MTQLIDLYGNSLTHAPTDELQSNEAQLAYLRHHFAEHPSNGLTPPRLANIMLQAEHGDIQAQCELARDIEDKDGHVFAELQKRRRALLGLERSVVPPRNPSAAEQRDTDMLNELLDDMTTLDDLILNMSDAVLKSFACHELEWHVEEKQHMPRFHFRDQGWFQTHPVERNELRLRDSSYEGAQLRPFGWITHTHQAKTGYLGESALARVLAWPFLFKNYGIRDLAEFLEIYGLPLRLGEYPAGANTDEKATLLKAVMSIGHNAGGIIPKGMSIDFKEAAKGTEGPFMAMVDWCERTQSKTILGGTLTSQADGKTSTNALGNVHNEVRQELRDSDARQLAATLTRDLIFPLYALNGKSFSGQHRMPRFEFDLTERKDLAYYSQHLPTLVDLDLKISTKWLHEELQIPIAKDDEPVLQRQPVMPASLRTGGVPVATLRTTEPDPLAPLVEELHNQAMAGTDLILDQIQQIVNTADSFDDVREKLIALQPDASQLADTLAEALTVASLSGRYDILQEAQG